MVSKRYYKTQAGFSLIEILISLVILAVGLLGLGNLQLFSLKGANNAHFRTVASLAATDLVDRMRVNPVAVANGKYTASLGIQHCATTLGRVCEAANECDSDALANYDLYRVNCGVKKGRYQTGGIQYDLPQATLNVSCASAACTNGVEHLVVVAWKETDNHDADDDLQARSYQLLFIP